ncbi:hypothetical protein QT970_13435 [Microcoleus sp. herbarium8]|uniref:hypothetical protein n=1 Tax=Microcoleus sp. herbarium8 TaxID=3055436 RepID=UPI002FD202EC
MNPKLFAGLTKASHLTSKIEPRWILTFSILPPVLSQALTQSSSAVASTICINTLYIFELPTV